MPRVSGGRPAAEPVSANQRARHRRIVKAATKLGADKGFDGMQMYDVAREAGVAIATLYRYFPSKTHLFTAVLADQLDRLSTRTADPEAGQDPVDAVADLLVDVSERMLLKPLLAHAMLQSNQVAQASTGPDIETIDSTFRELMLRMLGIGHPTDYDTTLVRLLEQCWYGVLLSTLSGRTPMADAEHEIRIACRLLLAPRSNADADVQR